MESVQRFAQHYKEALAHIPRIIAMECRKRLAVLGLELSNYEVLSGIVKYISEKCIFAYATWYHENTNETHIQHANLLPSFLTYSGCASGCMHKHDQ